MKKKILFGLICSFSMMLPLSVCADNEYDIVAYKDTYVRSNQTWTNYGSESLVTSNGSSRAYFSFDYTELKNDDAKVLNPPSPNMGFWYEADITKAIERGFKLKNRKLDIQFAPKPIAKSSMNGTFQTRESQFNKPHIKIVMNDDNTVVKSAKLYIFGGTLAPRVEVNYVESYDEMKVTYDTRPLVGAHIAYAYKNHELSGVFLDDTKIETVSGMSYQGAMTSTMTSFEAAFPDEIEWDEIYDVKQVPSIEQVIDDFNRTNPNGEHPRIVGNKESWERIRKWYKEGNEYVVKWAESILASAESSVKNINNIPREFTWNSSGSDMRYRGGDIPVLGKAYQLTLDTKYSDAAYKKMEIMAHYSHWNASGKDLNIGDCALNVGTAFDLVYDALTPEQREVVVGGIVRHVMNTRIGRPNGNYNNWNPVTNGGMGIAALAIMNEEPRIGAQMVVQSVKTIPKSLMEYYPHGSFPEGPSYWGYMTSNLFGFTAALNETCGSSYGIEDFPGLSTTGYYALYTQGPTSDIRFKYGDDKNKTIGAETFMYLAKTYDNPDFMKYQFGFIKENNSYAGLGPYWLDEDSFKYAEEKYNNIPLDRRFDGYTPVATMRSGWNDPNSLFFGIKGGYPQISHADLDIGTFILAANGVEWSKEYYPLDSVGSGFPSHSRKSRYFFYSSSPQGHNTLLFNPGSSYPDMDLGQSLGTHSKFEKSYSDENSAYVVLDMSDAYKKYVNSARRGIALINNRREFLIQDEIMSSASNLTYWFMHTDKDITVDGDTAILTSGEKRLYCKILEPANAQFSIMDAKPLPKTPGIYDHDLIAFEGEKKLAIKTELRGNQKISVWMVPLTKYDEIPTEEPKVYDIDKWPMPESEVAKLSMIKVNGQPIEDFEGHKFVYDVKSGAESFDVEFEGDGVSVNKIEKQECVILECTSPGKKKSRYVINIAPESLAERIKITASSVPQPANSPEMTLDGDLTTRWASTNEQTIEYDLGEPVMLDSVLVAFYQGAARMYNFKIEISEDGDAEKYETVFDGKSSGATGDLEKYSFDKRLVRYVKITCNKSNANEWNNVAEVVFGYAE